jgi:hypothetical protein
VGASLTDTHGVKDYVDALAAIVPAEVLAAHAVILTFTTRKASASGEHGAVISDPAALRVAFVCLVLMSAGFYLVGRRPTRVTIDVVVGAALPALAFVAWTMILPTSAFDALAPGVSFAMREVIGVLAAIVLPVAGTLLAGALDVTPPATAPAVAASAAAQEAGPVVPTIG